MRLKNYLNIAKQYTKEGDVAEALNVYRKIADLDPSNTHIRVKIAELCIKEDLKSEAVEEYLKAAEVLQSQSKGKEAEEVYQRVVQIDPKNERARAGITGLQSGDASTVSVKQETDPLSMVDSLISADKLERPNNLSRCYQNVRKPSIKRNWPIYCETQGERGCLSGIGENRLVLERENKDKPLKTP
jgi:tetratricopeptide (TPR) repeat protein